MHCTAVQLAACYLVSWVSYVAVLPTLLIWHLLVLIWNIVDLLPDIQSLKSEVFSILYLPLDFWYKVLETFQFALFLEICEIWSFPPLVYCICHLIFDTKHLKLFNCKLTLFLERTSDFKYRISGIKSTMFHTPLRKEFSRTLPFLRSSMWVLKRCN